MEQIVTVKLRVVVAGIPMSKRVALAGTVYSPVGVGVLGAPVEQVQY